METTQWLWPLGTWCTMDMGLTHIGTVAAAEAAWLGISDKSAMFGK